MDSPGQEKQLTRSRLTRRCNGRTAGLRRAAAAERQSRYAHDAGGGKQ